MKIQTDNSALKEKFEAWFRKAWPESSLDWYESAGRYYFGTFTQPAWEAAQYFWQAASESKAPQPTIGLREKLETELWDIRELACWDGPTAAPERMHEIWQRLGKLIEDQCWQPASDIEAQGREEAARRIARRCLLNEDQVAEILREEMP